MQLLCRKCRDELLVVNSVYLNRFKKVFPVSVSLSDRVQALRYLQLTRQLLSCSSDGGIAVWNMDTQREEVRIVASGKVTPVAGDQINIFPPAGAAVAGQRLLPEMRAALLLEHQADVGHQNPGPQTGSVPSAALPPVCHRISSSSLSSSSTSVPAAPLQEVREGRLREVQLQTVHVSNHGL